LRLVIGGTQSSVGKTTITLAVAAGAMRKGFRVQSFKVGPDYIDPSYHTLMTGRTCRNIDTWMVPKKRLIELIEHASERADLQLIEGVMGFYDGISGSDDTGSTAQVSRMTKSPCLLILDVSNMSRSAGAIVKGYTQFDRRVNIAGVILNKVAGESHTRWCKEAIEGKTGVKVVGAIPIEGGARLRERHLGLIPTAEEHTQRAELEDLVALILPHLDMDKILEIASTATPLLIPKNYLFKKKKPAKVKIGVAIDEAFNFYYQDALDILANRGASIVTFSPVHDSSMPEIDGLYIGGGFPEVMPKELERNTLMRHNMKKTAEDGTPIYAECGGLMYLTKRITGFEGKSYKMVGLLECDTVMTRRLTLNYTLAEVVEKNILMRIGNTIRGHEFHHSKLFSVPHDAEFAYRMKIGEGIINGLDGWISGNVLASYMHLHFASNLRIADCFISMCEKNRRL